MHSMLRQNQVRHQDVKPYIRSFTSNNPLDLGEWAKDEGTLFEPGTLIFLLEPAKRPPGMSSFARGQAGSPSPAELAQEAFRVKDMCVVVDKVDGKCWVLAISPSAFELRFIDTLFREKAQKSFLEGLDFNYLAAQPRPGLTADRLKELRQLSTLYSKSGSRRTVAQDGTGLEEPAKAMLTFLGADLGPSAGKQVMELGLICNLIFAPESVQENKTQSAVKSCFSPILATDKLKQTGAAPQPSAQPVVQSQEILNDEVSLLTQSYLENEAKEAEDYLKYAPATEPAAPTDSALSSGVWTSNPAAPTAPPATPTQATGGDEFRPLEPPPFDLGGFPSAPTQPAATKPGEVPLSLSPDIPSILTGDHPVIAIDAKLTPEDSNGQTDLKVPSLPAWYLTTHDVAEMNQVALKRQQQQPSAMPEGLDKLESELSYDALPVVDMRFRDGQAEPASSQDLAPAAPAPAENKIDFVQQFQAEAAGQLPPSSDIEASGGWPGGVASGGAAPTGKDFVDSIFEGSGGRGSLETNPSAEEPAQKNGPDWQTIEGQPSGTVGSGFVSPGSTAIPKPGAEPSAESGNLFNRLGGGAAPAEEENPAHAWADGQRGRPTNLKDMLTADSAVFTTSDRGKLEMPESMPIPAEPVVEPPAEAPVAQEFASPTEPPKAAPVSEQEPPAVAPETQATAPEPEAQAVTTASTAEADSAPAPWMKLPHHEVPAAIEPTTTAAEPQSEPAAEAPENYQELASALSGLMESPDAIEEAKPSGEADSVGVKSMELPVFSMEPAVKAEEVGPPAPEPVQTSAEQAFFSGEPSAPTAPTDAPAAKQESGDLFSDVMDKVLDLAEAKPESTAAAEPEPMSFYEDSRDVTQDIDAAMLQRLAGGPASLTLTGHTEESDQTETKAAEETPPPPAAPEPATSLVSPAMASHAESLTEPEAQTPEIEPVVSEAPSESPASPPAELSLDSAPESNLTPLRPSRRRNDQKALLPPPATPEPEEAPMLEEPTAPAAASTEQTAAPLLEEHATPVTTPAEEPLAPPPATPPAEAPVSTVEAQPEASSPPADEPPAPVTPAPITPASSLTTPVPSLSAEPVIPSPTGLQDSLLTISQELEIQDNLDSGVFLTGSESPLKGPSPYGQDISRSTASGLQRMQQPAVEPKLVISESTRFMARLNQRLSEADKKLSNRCDQSRDRLLRELDALIEEAHKVERQHELSTGTLTEQLMTHLETVSDEVKSRISKTSAESCGDLQQLIKVAEQVVIELNKELLKELESTESTFQADSESMSENTRVNLNQHAQSRLNEFNKKLDEITTALEAAYKHHVNVLTTRFGKFQSRLNEEVDAIISALDRNVGSMTVEIDGSWDRASEKLTASQTEFGNSVNFLVHSCRADIKQVHLDAYARRVLPRLLENKDIFRSMLLDMKRNFEEQSDKLRKQQLSGLEDSISSAKNELNTLTKECLSTIESVGKGQQFGLEDLYKNTSSRLEEIITTVENKLKTAKQEIVDNDEACMKTSEASRVEDEPAFSKEKQQAIAALNESRTKADNALETHISSSCLNLEHLSEEMQEELAKQRQEWTAQVRSSADESINQIKQAIQDAFQAIENAKEKFME